MLWCHLIVFKWISFQVDYFWRNKFSNFNRLPKTHPELRIWQGLVWQTAHRPSPGGRWVREKGVQPLEQVSNLGPKGSLEWRNPLVVHGGVPWLKFDQTCFNCEYWTWAKGDDSQYMWFVILEILLKNRSTSIHTWSQSGGFFLL